MRGKAAQIANLFLSNLGAGMRANLHVNQPNSATNAMLIATVLTKTTACHRFINVILPMSSSSAASSCVCAFLFKSDDHIALIMSKLSDNDEGNLRQSKNNCCNTAHKHRSDKIDTLRALCL